MVRRKNARKDNQAATQEDSLPKPKLGAVIRVGSKEEVGKLDGDFIEAEIRIAVSTGYQNVAAKVCYRSSDPRLLPMRSDGDAEIKEKVNSFYRLVSEAVGERLYEDALTTAKNLADDVR